MSLKVSPGMVSSPLLSPCQHLVLTWFAGNNIGGSTKRGVGIAMHVGFGNLGGAIAAFLYLAKYAPHFRPGHGATIGFLSMSLFFQVCMTLYLRKENKRRDATYKAPELYTVEEMYAEREKGDNAPFFRYTV